MTYRILFLGVALLSAEASAQRLINGSRILSGTINGCVSSTGSDSYSCSLSLTAYNEGLQIQLKADVANDGAACLNVSGLGCKTIKKAAGGILTDLAANDIRAGQFVNLVYDGVNFQMQSTLGNAPQGGGAALTTLNDGAAIGTRPQLNFVPGAFTSVSGSDNGTDQVSVTIDASAAALRPALAGVNAQTGATYTAAQDDAHKLVTFANTSSVTLPQAGAGGLFGSEWFAWFENRGTGTVTLTPTISSIDGASSLTLAQHQGAAIFSDGVNYFSMRGGAGAAEINVQGTANEIASSGSGAAPVLSLPAAIDLGGKTSFEIPNAAAPAVDAFGEIAGDNDAWAAGRGAAVFYDGTGVTRLVGVLSSDAPSSGQVPKWNTDGTITWEDDAGGLSGALTSAGNIPRVLSSGVLEHGRLADNGTDVTLSATTSQNPKFTFQGWVATDSAVRAGYLKYVDGGAANGNATLGSVNGNIRLQADTTAGHIGFNIGGTGGSAVTVERDGGGHAFIKIRNSAEQTNSASPQNIQFTTDATGNLFVTQTAGVALFNRAIATRNVTGGITQAIVMANNDFLAGRSTTSTTVPLIGLNGSNQINIGSGGQSVSFGGGAVTGIALDAEGTGNVLTLPTPIYLQAAACAGTTGALSWDTLASNAPTAACSAGATETTMMRGSADFPDSDGDYSLQRAFLLPVDWTGAIDAKMLWHAAATTGSAVWQIGTACSSDAEVEDVAFNAASTVTDAAKATTLQLNQASITGLTATGCAAGDVLHVKVFRNRTHASDTITGVISLVGVELTLRRAI